MTKVAHFFEKKRNYAHFCEKMTRFCVCFCIFFTRLGVGGAFGEDILDRESFRGMEEQRLFSWSV
ncbi:MAG: hypothetical protein ACYS1A_15260 [Planctomycetota bacterium]